MEFILASASPRRKELLELAGIAFRAVPSDVDELLDESLTPSEQVMDLAQQKARDLGEKFPDKLIIGADTIVVIAEKILGKPQNEADAVLMLKTLSGRKHQVMTAVCILGISKSIERVFVNCTDVSFYGMDEDWIWDYVKSGQPMDKAGSYGIQDKGFELVEKIEGDYYSVMGLPISQLKRELKALGLI